MFRKSFQFTALALGLSAFAFSGAEAVPLTTGSTGSDQLQSTIQPSLALTPLVCTSCGVFERTGEVVFFGGTFAPRGWAKAEGQLLAIGQNTELFSKIGTTYGGDGRTTFALPDMRGRTVIGDGNGPGLNPQRRGQKTGVENVLLPLPSHNHPLLTSPGGNTAPAGGGSQLYTNMQPSLALDFRVPLQGVFPSRGPGGSVSTNPTMGMVEMYAGFDHPELALGRDYVSADGQILAISQNPALFSILGTTYGGDGRTSFALPDLQGRTPIGAGNGLGQSPQVIGQKTGIETLTMTELTMAQHLHPLDLSDPSAPGGTSSAGGSQPQTNMQPTLGLNYMVAVETGFFPPGPGGQAMLGQIGLFAGNFAPRGWLFADGTLLSVSQHSALFSILGATYGGDGRTTFALPDLRGRVAVGAGQGPGLRDWRLGETMGTQDNTQTVAQLRTHTHTYQGAVVVLSEPGMLAIFGLGLVGIGFARHQLPA